jgi:hypothetical protein
MASGFFAQLFVREGRASDGAAEQRSSRELSQPSTGGFVQERHSSELSEPRLS